MDIKIIREVGTKSAEEAKKHQKKKRKKKKGQNVFKYSESSFVSLLIRSFCLRHSSTEHLKSEGNSGENKDGSMFCSGESSGPCPGESGAFRNIEREPENFREYFLAGIDNAGKDKKAFPGWEGPNSRRTSAVAASD